jgi:aminopeptidase N
MWQQMPGVLEVLGRRFGEYPFFDDKFAVVHAPYYGMEHQTVVAYGALFTDNDYGFDELLLHEVAHEWWGNKVSVSDWADFWIHEGFSVYAEALYVLDTLGEARYLDYMAGRRGQIDNEFPLVRGRNLTSNEAYSLDIYYKGAWVLHTLKWLLGDEDFFEVVWRFANDQKYAYSLVSSKDLADLVHEVSGRDIDWFWDRYLFRKKEPEWRLDRQVDGDGESITLRWDDPDFELPLPVVVGGEERRIEMENGLARFRVEGSAAVEVDPLGRILAKSAD